MRKSKSRVSSRLARRGSVAIEYVLVLAVTFPASVALLVLLKRYLTASFYFITQALGASL